MNITQAEIQVDQARRVLHGALRHFLMTRTAAFWHSRDVAFAAAKQNKYRPTMDSFVSVYAVPVGLGKSSTAGEVIGEFLKDPGSTDRAIAYFVPRHRLADELAEKFTRKTGLPAAIWRGIDADDPEHLGKKMCREPELATAANAAHVKLETVCALCPSRNDCGYRRQQQQEAKLWFLPHQSLFSSKPTAIDDPKAIVIDESFWQAGLSGSEAPVTFAVSSLHVLPCGIAAEDHAFLEDLRGRLINAVASVGHDGRLTREILDQARVTEYAAQDAAKVEWSAKPKFKATGRIADLIQALKAQAVLFDARMPRIWKMIERSLRKNARNVAGLRIRRNAKLPGNAGHGDVFEMQWCREIAESWSAIPTLILDATARVELIEPYFTVEPHIKIKPVIIEMRVNHPHQHITQVADCSFSKKMFVGSGLRAQSRDNNIERLAKLISVKAFEHCGKSPDRFDVLVVAQQEIEMALLRRGMPPRVKVRHFNDVAGEDSYKSVACLISVGRTLPNLQTIEMMAETIAGRELTSQGVNDNWPIKEVTLTAENGSMENIRRPNHPDKTAEAARWSIAEGNLIQALGRARGINRTAENPVEIILLSDLALPVDIRSVRKWGDIQANRFQIAFMHGGGNMPTSDAELARIYGPNGLSGKTLWKSEEAVRSEKRGLGEKGVKSLLGSLIENSPPYSAAYRRDGQRGRWSPCLVRSRDEAIARAELGTLVGNIAAFRYEEASETIWSPRDHDEGLADVSDAA